MTAGQFGLETIELDLPELVAAFSRRLAERGLLVGTERSVALARALTLTRPVSRRRLYWTARAVIVTDPGQLRAFDAVFMAVFGAGRGLAEIPDDSRLLVAADDPAAPSMTPPPGPTRDGEPEHRWSRSSTPASARGTDDDDEPRELPVATVASDEEVIRDKRFDALDADELVRLYALMARLALATPRRLTRRRRGARHGAQVDLRRTLRASLRTGAEPVRLARRRRVVQRRRLVLLCDISGSMEPYARAYLQFLACAMDPAGRNEAFLFATRLTRVTRALHAGRPQRALAAAAATAPDWSSGTRIGDALRTFNDRHGRRGMARGAVVVIISDGWERGDPSLVGRELARLSRLAYRIVWVNPRVAASGFAPRAGGMAAALPHCDALVSGHSLRALEEVVEAIGADRRRDREPTTGWRPQAPTPEAPEPAESWASASDWAGAQPGSSVAMPSGYGPARGRTTDGWSR